MKVDIISYRLQIMRNEVLSMKILKSIGIGALVISLSAGTIYFGQIICEQSMKEISNEAKKETKTEVKAETSNEQQLIANPTQPVVNPTVYDPKKDPSNIGEYVPQYKTEQEIYSIMHQMANPLIIAEDGNYFGGITILDRRLDRLVDCLDKSNYADKDKLLAIIKRWRNADFSTIVDDHNYCWEKLGGDVGRAIKPQDAKTIQNLTYQIRNHLE